MGPKIGASPSVFPTQVGMNRQRGIIDLLLPCVPHAGGDEPKALILRFI